MKNAIITTLVLGIGLSALAGCSSAQLEADLQQVEACARDPRVEACVVDAVAQGGPEPETALACVQLCLAQPGARSYRLEEPR